MKLANLGILGLGTMGAAIARNAARKKFSVAVYNRTKEKTDQFIAVHHTEGQIIPTKSVKQFVLSLETPRRILLMVTAGPGTDGAIQELVPHLTKGDIIIDGGNAHYKDTSRRRESLALRGIEFVGCGISGGEDGALHGPSMMVGGSAFAWKHVKPIFTTLAARDKKQRPCVAHIGGGGAGHYVKMVHNGIEYGVMQIIAEVYAMLRDGCGLKAGAIADIFVSINNRELRSFLLETAVCVLQKKDDLVGRGFLVDRILAKAGQKGTGMWTSVEGLERNIPVPTITEAVYARYMSNASAEKIVLGKKRVQVTEDIKKLLHQGILAAIISTFLQGLSLIEATSKEEKWHINLAEVSRIWQNGCIIRMNLLDVFEQAYRKKQRPYIILYKKGDEDLRKIVSLCVTAGIPAPALTSALMYMDMLGQKQGNANLIQGMRDLFGAHTYERIDRKGIFHTDWN